MSTVTQTPPRQHGTRFPLDQDRGTWGMYSLILTEMSLFICLFGSYFYLENNKNRWAIDQPPKLHLALIMLAVLVSSSFVLQWGEKQVEKGRDKAGRIALAVTIFMGLCFLTIQGFEYLDHWKSLTPYSDSYGSIFYTMTTFHAMHVIVGLMMLCYALILPRYSPAGRSPYRPYHVVALYWHFVDIVWFFIVGLLYVMPNIRVYVH